MVAVAVSARGWDEGGEAFDELEWGEAQDGLSIGAMPRCCLIHLKNNSTCQRALYSVQIVVAGGPKRLVRNTKVLPDSVSLKRMRRRCIG